METLKKVAAGLMPHSSSSAQKEEAAREEEAPPSKATHAEMPPQMGMVTPGRLQPQPTTLHAPASDRPAGVAASQPAGGSPAEKTAISLSPSRPRLTVHIGVSDEQGHRNYMEDRHTIIPDFRPEGEADPDMPRQFVAVYDGHSSYHGSEHASRRVHQFIAAQPAIQQCSGAACDQAAIEDALKSAFEDVDTEIVKAAVKGGKRYGTTAVCALRMGQTVYVAHAGDSRAVLCREGRAITLTQDHKPASVPAERERIEAHGGVVDPAVNYVINTEGDKMVAMSRALGDPDFKEPRRLVEAEPDVARVELRPHADSFLLLGSDGLFDVMSGQEAVDAANEVLKNAQGKLSGDVAETVAEALVQKAMKDGTNDNVTALITVFEWA